MQNSNLVKFVSKTINYRITLKSGIQGSPIHSIPDQPGVYARFEHGQLLTNDQKLVDALRSSDKLGTDFWEVKDEKPGEVPKEYLGHRSTGRDERHDTLDTSSGAPTRAKSAEEHKAEVRSEAKEMLKSMLPELEKMWLEKHSSKDEAPKEPEVAKSETASKEPKEPKEPKAQKSEK